jgi:hypothetical protein
MRTIQYLATYNEHDSEIITVAARDINSGLVKAVREACKPLGNGTRREIVSVAFFMVRS